MKLLITLLLFLFVSFCVAAEELDLDGDILFRGVIKQAHDYSCGSAALSTLISGLIENAQISEHDIMKEIITSENQGYSLADLMNASKKLGFYAEWQKVSPSELEKINIPVMLLIGLNSQFSHFVVLKGVYNGEAFLADSIRGNIRIPYKKLIDEGINKKYNAWFVMAIDPSANKPKNSTLYLSSDKYKTHFTIEQSNAITLVTVTRKNQLIVNYNFSTSLSSISIENWAIKSRGFNHSVGARYGITENTELGAVIYYSDYRQKQKNNDNLFIANSESKSYDIYVNHKISLDESNVIILGSRTSFDEYASTWGGGLNLTGYTNTLLGQFIAGASVNKQFSSNYIANANLANYQVSGFISANKPIGDKFLGSVSLLINDSLSKKSSINEFHRSYVISTSLSYVISESFQVTPMFNYSFANNSDTFSFGASLIYIGGW